MKWEQKYGIEWNKLKAEKKVNNKFGLARNHSKPSGLLFE